MRHGFLGDSGLPPGCRASDLEPGNSRVADLPAAALWTLLDEMQRAVLYRDFFRRRWAELAACLEENDAAGLAACWETWRDRAVDRMAMAGEIRSSR